MSHAMECVVRKELDNEGYHLAFHSIFNTEYYTFVCRDSLTEDYTYPNKGFDKEEVEALRDWLNKVLQNYDATSNLCQNCFKPLPYVATLMQGNYWIVTCKHCEHKHELGKCH